LAVALFISPPPPPPRVADSRSKYLCWMDRGELPSDRTKVMRITRKAKSFTVIDGELYKRAASGILHRCIPIPESRELIRDIHTGVCGHHTTPRNLVGYAFCEGFC
jgi:hypothetical protein